MKKIFLGGTCPGWDWRKELIKKLNIDYYNPVVPVWNDTVKKIELEERQNCDYCLYVITPYMKGVYSIAEVIDDSNKRPEKTIFCYLNDPKGKSFDNKAENSLKEVGNMVKRNGGSFFKDLNEIANYVNIKNSI